MSSLSNTMLKLAIIDDDMNHNELVYYLLNEHYPGHFQYEVYTNSRAFIHDIDNNIKSFDIVLLDIKMDWMNGINVGLYLRKEHIDSKIILITAYNDFVLDGYEIGASNYLLKPLDKTRLYTVIDRAIYEIERNNMPLRIAVKTQKGTDFVVVGQIAYISSYKRTTTIFTIDGGQYTAYKSISQHERDLKAFNFIRPHKSYLVNPKHVDRANTDSTVSLCNGMFSVPISRPRRNEFMRNMMIRVIGND